MATTITFNGTNFSVPALGDTGWASGPGNLSAYLIAIASGTLQTTGGTFTLSADINFGGSFGIIAKYLTSASSSPATSGVIRLAAGDTINFGTSNFALGESGGNLQWRGATIVTGQLDLTSQVTGILPLANGGTGQSTAQAAMDSLAGGVSSGQYLRGNGTHVVLSTIQAGDVPTLNQNTTGSAGSCTGNSATATSATTATNLAGGAASQIPYQTGSGATAFLANGTSGQILTSNGSSAPSWTNASGSFPPVSTRTVLTSGSSATYTTPANCRQIKIRMVGGGGGGGSNDSTTSVAGSNGGNSSFNSIVANAGSGGAGGVSGGSAGGAGGSSGSGSASFRIAGQNGALGTVATGGGAVVLGSGAGGSSAFGGGGASIDIAGVAGATNSGSGGSGGGSQGGNQRSGGGGGSGEYLELIITSPSASYTYTVGSGGAGGTSGGSRPAAGGAGAAGIIIVDEYY